MDFKEHPSVRVLFNKYRNKWRALKEELKDVEHLSDLAWSEFYPEFQKALKAKNIKDPFLEQENVPEKKNTSVFSEECIKMIYREVAKKSHPDKNGSSKVESFQKISKAKKDGDLNIFLDEAKKIEKKKIEVSYSLIDKLEEEISDMEKKIEQLRGTFFLNWYYAPKVNRSKIMNQIINYYEKKKS
tara:strand:- start:8256 stop:8813 length:558 start_codon:yes stop_codon:yes gene_type:complete